MITVEQVAAELGIDEHTFISPAKLALHFDVEEKTILDWRRQYKWPSIKVGRVIRFTADNVAEILEKHTVRPKAPEVETSAGVVIHGQTKRSAARSRR